MPRQSIALVRTFKRMKDYILENRDIIGQREILQLSMEAANNRIEINKINSDMISLENQISDVAKGLKDAGARITSIVEDYGVSKYALVIATVLKNPTLIFHNYLFQKQDCSMSAKSSI